MKTLPLPDAHHLRAAHGWLELGNPPEASEELKKIEPKLHTHPEVLELRYAIFRDAKKWDACVDIAAAILTALPGNPHGWILRSFALHELRRTREAFDNLLPAAATFPEVWTIPYNLACYCAQLGEITKSREWFNKALAIDKKTVRHAALDDPDLLPLWDGTNNDPQTSPPT